MKHIEFETAKILNKKGFTESNGNAYLLTEFKNCVTNPENVVNSPIGTMIGYSIKDKTIPAPYQEEVIEVIKKRVLPESKTASPRPCVVSNFKPCAKI